VANANHSREALEDVQPLKSIHLVVQQRLLEDTLLDERHVDGLVGGAGSSKNSVPVVGRRVGGQSGTPEHERAEIIVKLLQTTLMPHKRQTTATSSLQTHTQTLTEGREFSIIALQTSHSILPVAISKVGAV
jgi:hypothetical protein